MSTAGRMYAAHWSGSGPTATGQTPVPSTSPGTSTHASGTRFGMSAPRLITLATIRAGSPVSIECTITAAYSPLRSISNGSPASSIRLVSAYSSRLCATRDEVLPDRDVVALDGVAPLWG